MLCLSTNFSSSNLHAETNPSIRSAAVFHVKYVSETSVYLDAGRNAGIQKG